MKWSGLLKSSLMYLLMWRYRFKAVIKYELVSSRLLWICMKTEIGSGFLLCHSETTVEWWGINFEKNCELIGKWVKTVKLAAFSQGIWSMELQIKVMIWFEWNEGRRCWKEYFRKMNGTGRNISKSRIFKRSVISALKKI